MRLWARAGQRQAPQPQTLDQLLDLCSEVAEAAGGLFGLAFTGEPSERDAIREIASSLAIGPALPEPVRQAWSEETIANAHKTPMGRAGYAEDFPGAALFFASDASAWITGTCLRVDGGVARQLGL
jgi:NAD(P)-dependent dehydrogenase (short-subunit alcohol dehydrogenase family)